MEAKISLYHSMVVVEAIGVAFLAAGIMFNFEWANAIKIVGLLLVVASTVCLYFSGFYK